MLLLELERAPVAEDPLEMGDERPGARTGKAGLDRLAGEVGAEEASPGAQGRIHRLEAHPPVLADPDDVNPVELVRDEALEDLSRAVVRCRGCRLRPGTG